jgi:hypothetical protein
VPLASLDRVLVSLARMHRDFSRYGSSALVRRNRVLTSGSASRSLARLADRSSDTPRSRRDTDTSLIKSSSASSTARMPCSCCSSRTSRVTFGVTYGLPSRSPPIQVPKVNGRDVGAVSTPSFFNVSDRSSRTCGAASA